MKRDKRTLKRAERRAEYDKLFRDVDEAERNLVDRLIDEVIYYEEQMDEIKKLPFISVHPTKPNLQKTTAAARLYKEYATSYMNALRILLNILRKVESEEQNELLRKLEEFA